MITPLEILIAARALLLRGWTQGAYARDASGVPCNSDSEHAECWCFEGAVNAVAYAADAYPEGAIGAEVWRKEEMVLRQRENEATLRLASNLDRFLSRHGADRGDLIDAIAELRTKLAAIVGKAEPR
jgi:hypothetical protein